MANINLPLDIESLEIIGQHIDSEGNIILNVVSKCTETTCHKCGKPATKRYGHSYPIKVRHTSILDTPVYLQIKPVRYQCADCDTTTTEQYAWCDRNAKVTKKLEEYIMRSLINSTIKDVSLKENLSYKTITRIVHRLINKKVDWSEYSDLTTLGIDEISDKKGHQDYLTIVSVKTKSGDLSVIAVLDDRAKDTVLDFFNSIPQALKKTVKTVCCDMHDGFVYTALETFGSQAVVIDRFHVAKLYRAPLDSLRIKEMARLKEELEASEYAKLEGMMWILRKQHECLTQVDRIKLELLYKYSPILKVAHSYALKLTHIFNTHSNRRTALAKINRWIKSVGRSELTCFKTFIKSLKKYQPWIANYFKSRKSSGFVEGLNNKIKVTKRRCYGFFNRESLFQRLVLDLKGYEVFA